MEQRLHSDFTVTGTGGLDIRCSLNLAFENRHIISEDLYLWNVRWSALNSVRWNHRNVLEPQYLQVFHFIRQRLPHTEKYHNTINECVTHCLSFYTKTEQTSLMQISRRYNCEFSCHNRNCVSELIYCTQRSLCTLKHYELHEVWFL
jgi:hypothetical protein